MPTANLGLALEMHARLSGRKLEQPEEMRSRNNVKSPRKSTAAPNPFLMPDICSHQGKLKNSDDQLTGHIVLWCKRNNKTNQFPNFSD